MSEEHDYEVGFKKPPQHSRFQPGQSGNPKGRPKSRRNFSTDVKSTLTQPVRVTSGGKPKTISTQAAALERLRERALNGDLRALDRLLELARIYNEDAMEEAVARLGPNDAEIMERFKARLLRREGLSPAKESGAGAGESNEAVDPKEEGEQPDEDEDAWLR